MLINETTFKEMKIGDPVQMRDESGTITDITEGRVYVMNDSGIPTMPYAVFYSVVDALWIDTDVKTYQTMQWMKAMTDDQKQVYAINWKMPHTLFNVSCKYKNADELQGIDWHYLYKNGDMGNWSHGGKVYVQSFS